MNDSELMELAAKAAGVIYDGFDDDQGCDIWWLPDLSRFDSWNPLTNDGDALRLAVKLAAQSRPGNGLNIFLHHDESVVYGPGEGFLHKHGNDPYQATRRAIVRAAAEIGKAMP